MTSYPTYKFCEAGKRFAVVNYVRLNDPGIPFPRYSTQSAETFPGFIVAITSDLTPDQKYS